jgi:hypothetical protein
VARGEALALGTSGLVGAGAAWARAQGERGLGTGGMGEDAEQPGGEEKMITYRVPCKRCQGEEG